MNNLTYPEIHRLVISICDEIIRKSKDYNGVYGIRGGGLVPASMIAYRLKIPVTNVFSQKHLIVDDCIFIGHTIRPYLGLGMDIAVVCCHEKQIHNCQYYGKLIDKYYRFPWEDLMR